MRKTATLALFLVTVLCSTALSRVFELEKLLRDAYKTSNELRTIEKELQKAEAQVNEAMGTALPTVSTSVNYAYSISQYSPFSMPSSSEPVTLVDSLGAYGISPYDSLGRSMYMVAGAMDQMLQSLNSIAEDKRKNSLSLSLSINQPIYAQGKVGIGLKIAETHQSMLVCKYNEVKLRVKAKVITRYHATLIAKKNFEVARQNLNLLEKSHQISVTRFNVGNGSEFDTLSTQLYLQNAKADLYKAESDLRLAKEALVLAAGLSVSPENFQLEGEIPDMPFEMTLEQAIDNLHSNNYTVNQLKGSTELSDYMVRLAKSDFRPMIFAGASFGRVGRFTDFGDMNQGSNWSNDHKVFVGMNWTLFSGLQRTQKLRQAQMDRSITYINEQQIIENLELAVKNAYEQVMINRNRLEAIRSVMDLAEKSYGIAAKAYEVGQRPLIDMRNAELEMTRARTNYNAVLFAYLKAVVDLQVLTADL
ncbi:MAG: TolC family protein [Chitinispirillaceae bacterium]